MQQKTITPQRLKVLANIAECIKPITAYGLKSRLEDCGTHLNISTIYRVLEFWIQMGIVHKVDSNKTYLVCRNRQNDGLHIIEHCISCNGIAEKTEFLGYLASSNDPLFAPIAEQVIELKGECKLCLDKKKSPD